MSRRYSRRPIRPRRRGYTCAGCRWHPGRSCRPRACHMWKLKFAEKLGQRALRRPLSAPGRAPGCPEPRPASATQPIGPRWHPGHSGLALDIVARHIGLGDGPVDQRVALAAMCGGEGMEVTGGRGRASGERRAARRTRAIGRISAHPFSRARRHSTRANGTSGCNQRTISGTQ